MYLSKLSSLRRCLWSSIPHHHPGRCCITHQPPPGRAKRLVTSSVLGMSTPSMSWRLYIRCVWIAAEASFVRRVPRYTSGSVLNYHTSYTCCVHNTKVIAHIKCVFSVPTFDLLARNEYLQGKGRSNHPFPTPAHVLLSQSPPPQP